MFSETHEPARAAEKEKAQSKMERQRLLLFRAGSFERLAIPLSLVARLEEFPRSAIEHAGGGQVIQYRGRILSLVSLRAVLDPGASDSGPLSDPAQVVVFNDGDRSVGMVVDQILDVVEEAVTVRQKSVRKGLLGSAVVDDRITDFLDLNEFIRVPEGNWTQGIDGDSSGKRVLIADGSGFTRGMIRSGLDMAGYVVIEAASLDEAIRRLEKQPVDVVVAALDLPPEGGISLLASLRSRLDWEEIPVLAVGDSADMIRTANWRSAGFQDCQLKFDSVAILESVAQLVPATALVQVASAGEKR
jgi:two-component system chemotaxis sensor kinase CheA